MSESLDISKEYLCYVCQEGSSDSSCKGSSDSSCKGCDDFCDTNICACTGSNRIHTQCFRKLRNQELCSICNSEFKNVEHLIVKEELILRKISQKDDFGWNHEYFLDQKGRKQGSHKIYYMNGLLWEETHYKNDLKHGFQKVWNYKGKMFVNQTYKNGLIQN